ncbi:MAG: CMP-N,N-diacetyllegionaminic acid synthase [Polaromonas sp.]|jgi:CMP-N,N'-diacetyllegionaminic acid synthase|nr:CMP-N,N-diacetyllegionaminic acid synthase [Polaromonas sp.]
MSGSVIATICARGGSKGLPGKNIREFLGRPLIVHSIAQALSCQQIDAVYVSTDDEAIARVAREAGAQVPFLRPVELATDTAPKLPVIEHLVAALEREGLVIARIVDLQPTSPLRQASDIAGALEAAPNVDLTVSITPSGDNPYFNLVEQGADGLVRLSKGNGSTRRQDTPAVYALNGSIYVWQRAALAHAAVHGLWSVRIAPYGMPRWKSVDIDDIDDFDYALWLAQRHLRDFHG